MKIQRVPESEFVSKTRLIATGYIARNPDIK